MSAFVGDGANRWPAVHRHDAARLFRLVVESAPAGSALHAVAEEGIAFRDIAAAIATRLGLPTESRATDHFGLLAPLAGLDSPTSSALTRSRLGWRPTGPALIEDISAGIYSDAEMPGERR
ncbi:Rossmann-fold NAD(P)-binding domain-containing protein [Catenuloplanes japonicus]|uniref:hypothetical protein n=1 Tax=Catenuloplanes japonicus TaxID=33876 RepID=UPI00068EA53D|nr:hypothetical protein [Catenuloplanes japonicus]